MSEPLAVNPESLHDSTREHLVANGEASVGRLPALKLIFQDAAHRFGRKIRETTGEGFHVVVEEVNAGRIGQMNNIDDLCVRAVNYYAEELKLPMVVAASFDFVSSLIEVLFSGSPSRPFAREDRTLTKLEMRATDFAINSLADSLADAFMKIVDLSFSHQGSTNAIDWTKLGRKGSIVVVCKCRIWSHGQEANAFFLVPRAALDPFREALARDPDSKGTTQNSAWTARLQNEVVKTRVSVSAVMERQGFTLDDVARFKVGQVISLPASPDGVIPLKCGDWRLFGCTLGQKDGHYTVRIEDFVNDRQEFIQKVLGLDEVRGTADAEPER